MSIILFISSLQISCLNLFIIYFEYEITSSVCVCAFVCLLVTYELNTINLIRIYNFAYTCSCEHTNLDFAMNSSWRGGGNINVFSNENQK